MTSQARSSGLISLGTGWFVGWGVGATREQKLEKAGGLASRPGLGRQPGPVVSHTEQVPS